MFKDIETIDPNLLTIASGTGKVAVSNALQGRVFAAFGSGIIHRFLPELAANPDPDNFNNLGGNSLWPGPEGGDFAFNYPPAGEWYVQAGINRVPTETVYSDSSRIVVAKDIELINRKGKMVRLKFRRSVAPLTPEDFPAGKYDVGFTGYHTVDELIPLEDYSIDEVICCAWSLEQFPGAEGITAFGRCRGPAEECINSDFYGDPGERLSFEGNVFRFDLGGEKRIQIGIKADCKPQMIGALDHRRGILAVRFTPERNDGKYINIAESRKCLEGSGILQAVAVICLAKNPPSGSLKKKKHSP